MSAVNVQGFCDLRWLPVRDAFVQNFEDGLDIGAALAITHRGAPVVDLWAGHMDAARTRPWEKNTIVSVASTTKIMAIVMMLILIDRGKIALEERVAHYWPEFAQGGKDRVTVREAISHCAGVPGLDPPASAEMGCSFDAMAARIAAEPHWFGGEPRLCYHALTYGYILGELIRRVDGRTPGAFFREEIANKCGADFFIGLPPMENLPRFSTPIVGASAFANVGFGGKLLNAIDSSNIMSVERAAVENPGGNGVGAARAIARVCAILANGGQLDGVKYLSPEIIAEAGREQAYAQCPYMGWLRMGLGFGLDSKEFRAPSASTMHWGGYGGSWVLADPAARVSLGYTPNNWATPPPESTQLDINEDPRLGRFSTALRPILEALVQER